MASKHPNRAGTLVSFMSVSIECLPHFRGVVWGGFEKPIRVPGIGDVAADALENAGINTPLQLLGKYLSIADEEFFVSWLVSIGLTEWRIRDPEKGTLVALRSKCEQLFPG